MSNVKHILAIAFCFCLSYMFVGRLLWSMEKQIEKQTSKNEGTYLLAQWLSPMTKIIEALEKDDLEINSEELYSLLESFKNSLKDLKRQEEDKGASLQETSNIKKATPNKKNITNLDDLSLIVDTRGVYKGDKDNGVKIIKDDKYAK